MSNTVERFSNRVENYVKYRPGYPKEVLETFRTEMNLTENSVIADIGSGTGISAKLFLENGNTVYGIEPNAAMREAAEVFLKDFPKFRSIDGTAENTTCRIIRLISLRQHRHFTGSTRQKPAPNLVAFYAPKVLLF